MSDSLNTKSKVFSNTLYQLIGKLFSMSITVLCTVLIARVYGRESYGEFNIMQTWPAFVFIVVDFGFNAIATREISKDWSKAQKYYNSILWMRVFLSCAFILVMSVLLIFFPYSSELTNAIRLNLFLILTQALFSSTNVILQPKLRYDLSTTGYVLGYVYILIATVLMVYYRFPVWVISFNYVIGGLITFFANARFIKSLGIFTDFKLDKSVAKYLIQQSLPLGLMFVFSQINFKSDALMISALELPKNLGLSNTESVAIYGLPYKIFEVGLVLPTFIMNSIYPVLVKHSTESRAQLMLTFRKLLKLVAVLGVFTGIVGYLFAPLIVKIIGGEQFNDSVLVLQILLSGLVLYFLTQPLSWLLITLESQKHLPVIYLISAVFNLTANFIFIKRYSFYASAVITHLSELLILILLVIYVRKALKAKYV